MSRAFRQIQRIVRRTERTPRNTDRTTYRPRWPDTVDHVICKAYGTIAGMSSDTPGTGSAIVYDLSSAGAALVSRGSSRTIMNIGSEITTGEFFSAHRVPGSNPVWVAQKQGHPWWSGTSSGQSITTTSNTVVDIGADLVSFYSGIWTLSTDAELTIARSGNLRVSLTSYYSNTLDASINAFAILQKWDGAAWDSDVFEAAKDWSHIRTQWIFTASSDTPTAGQQCSALRNVAVTTGDKFRLVARKGSPSDGDFELGTLLDIQFR